MKYRIIKESGCGYRYKIQFRWFWIWRDHTEVSDYGIRLKYFGDYNNALSRVQELVAEYNETREVVYTIDSDKEKEMR